MDAPSRAEMCSDALEGMPINHAPTFFLSYYYYYFSLLYIRPDDVSTPPPSPQTVDVIPWLDQNPIQMGWSTRIIRVSLIRSAWSRLAGSVSSSSIQSIRLTRFSLSRIGRTYSTLSVGQADPLNQQVQVRTGLDPCERSVMVQGSDWLACNFNWSKLTWVLFRIQAVRFAKQTEIQTKNSTNGNDSSKKSRWPNPIINPISDCESRRLSIWVKLILFVKLHTTFIISMAFNFL